MKSVMVVAGTRPELIKLAPVFWELKRRGMDYVFVWSGQHYDYEMSRVFIEQLKLPEPDFDLGVGSGSHAVQTAKAMIGVEEAIRQYRPSIVMALGDTNTVIATALTSVKSLTPFAHIEAGLRSWNETMPEEINRKLADHISQMLFTPSEIATLNLLAEGIPSSRVIYTGNTIVDVLKSIINVIEEYSREIMDSMELNKPYILVTVHRQENVDDPLRLSAIVKALVKLASEYIIVMPLHPRSQRRLYEYNLMCKLKSRDNIRLTKPLGYFEFLYLLRNALAVLTDSGGIQEEAFIMKIPTITLRYNTERPETILLGCNVLAGADTNIIVEYTRRMIEIRNIIKTKLDGVSNPYGDGRTAEKIVDITYKYISSKQALIDPDLRDTPYIVYAVKKLSNLIPKLDDVLCYIAEDGSLTMDYVKAIAAYVRTRIKVMKPWESLSSL